MFSVVWVPGLDLRKLLDRNQLASPKNPLQVDTPNFFGSELDPLLLWGPAVCE